ncbi:4'-phosphopantetheinyl transferase family protein [Nocardioides sp. T2.26MG-1]|uniref:4'-phosphopantetheinyl transferase family protein n=1 Tax=Nocardioides sp. T2.26MG-1 TaxID=3041166 RepID=UPI002477598D|nr:hypothetical protein [Nocardioides sp. T2.26MG-1]CAI9400720.1 hypothetical protein HIDPHFAB_00460 [Nocardioides sp. T2.26MG-1]
MTSTPAAGPSVRVVWALGGDRTLADRLLADVLAGLPGSGAVDGHEVRRLCPWCGAADHGRPVLAGRSEPHLSISRAGPLTVVAVCDTAPVGVDVERADAAGAESTVTWVRTEALLKATGHGLRVDPATVRLSRPDQEPELLAWPEPAVPAVRLYDVETAPGFVTAAAVLATDPAELVVSPAGPGAARATATP